MSTKLAERTLIGLLPDENSLVALAREGIDLEVIPTPEMRPVVEWSLRYMREGGTAPSAAVLNEEFGDLLSDLEYSVSDIPEEMPTETIQWAIKKLNAAFIRRTAAKLYREAAQFVMEADDEEVVDAFNIQTSKQAAIGIRLAPRASGVDLREGFESVMAEYDRIAASGNPVRGLTFGLPEVDDFTLGVWEGELCLLAAPPKTGKAQPLDTPVLTPTGWTPMGDLRSGSRVVGADGKPTTVVGIHPQGDVDVFRVTTSDGASTLCCGDHLWQVQTHDDRVAGRHRTMDTHAIRERLLSGADGRGLFIPMVAPVHYESSATLPIDPYVLGILIGDGGMTNGVTITSGDPEVFDLVSSRLPGEVGLVPARSTSLTRYVSSGVRGGRDRDRNPVLAALRSLGLYGKKSEKKFIPRTYLLSSVESRVQLLRGLMDSDGGMEKRQSTYATSSPDLAATFQELVESLGGTAKVVQKPTARLPSYKFVVRLPALVGCPFLIERKSATWRNTRPAKNCPPRRRVISVEHAGRRPAQCITVANADHLYVTERHMVTHNSWFADVIAYNEWKRERICPLYTLENSIHTTQLRIACIACDVSISDMMAGKLSTEDYQKLQWWKNDILEKSPVPLPIMHPDTAGRTAASIVLQAHAYAADSLVVDQLTFMETDGSNRHQTRPQEIREITHGLKNGISTGYRPLPCVLIHQINREGVKSAEKGDRIRSYHTSDGAEGERTGDLILGLYATEDQVVTSSATLSIMDARRVPKATWELNWNIEVGRVSVRGQLAS